MFRVLTGIALKNCGTQMLPARIEMLEICATVFRSAPRDKVSIEEESDDGWNETIFPLGRSRIIPFCG